MRIQTIKYTHKVQVSQFQPLYHEFTLGVGKGACSIAGSLVPRPHAPLR